MNTRIILGTIISALLLLYACRTEERSYKKANKTGNIQAYEKFVHEYPDGKYSDTVKMIIDSLRYQQVASTDSIVLFNEFLKKYPESKFIENAGKKLKYLVFISSVGGKIVSDTTFFSKELANGYIFGSPEPGRTYTTRVVSEHPPKIEEIIEKYGKPDNIHEEDWTVTFTSDWKPLKTRMIVYHYGRFIFAVEKKKPEVGVIYVQMVTPEGKQ